MSAVHVGERSPLQSVYLEASLRTRHVQLRAQAGRSLRPGRRRPQSVGGGLQTLRRLPSPQPGQAAPARLHLPRGRAQPGGRDVRDASLLSPTSEAVACDRRLLRKVPRHHVQAPCGSALQGTFTAYFRTRTSIPTSPKRCDRFATGIALCNMIGAILRISQVC